MAPNNSKLVGYVAAEVWALCAPSSTLCAEALAKWNRLQVLDEQTQEMMFDIAVEVNRKG